ncbi:hypothetical protein ABIE62_001567 [Porphyrobacter sp. MBR-155]|jgi:hypothetical protein
MAKAKRPIGFPSLRHNHEGKCGRYWAARWPVVIVLQFKDSRHGRPV